MLPQSADAHALATTKEIIDVSVCVCVSVCLGIVKIYCFIIICDNNAVVARTFHIVSLIFAILLV